MRMPLALLLVILSGFISLSYEIVWFRVISFMSSGAAYAFALLLWAYLTGIALGSAFARKISSGEESRSPRMLRMVAGLVVVANLGGYLCVPLISHIAAAGLHVGVALIPVVVVAAALGAQFPLIAHYGVEPDEQAGARVSYLYLGNIVGSVAGSLVTGFWLFDIWELREITAFLTILGLVMALAVYLLGGTTRRRTIAALAAAAVLAAGGVLAITPVVFDGLWLRLLFHEKHDRAEDLAHVVQNKSGVITVTEDGTIYGGGGYDGWFNVDPVEDVNAIFRAYAMGLFHPEPKEVLMVGLASGSWAAVVANHPDVEKLTVVEINPGYVDLLSHYQPHAKLLEDPRVEIIIDDGRHWLNRFPERRFDAIVVNTTFHWRSQVTNLLSHEWMQLVAEHLEPGGIYMFNTTDSRRVYRTALDTFGHAMRLANTGVVSQEPIDYDPARWRRLLKNYELWGEPVLDLDNPEHRRRLEEFIEGARDVDNDASDATKSSAAVEGGDSLDAWTRGAEPITDENMGEEWSAFVDGAE